MKKNNKNLFFALGAGIAACAAAYAYYNKNKKNRSKDDNSLAGDSEDEIYFDFSNNEESHISLEEAENAAFSAAQARLGKNVVIVSASDNKALTVNIGGSRRHCFMFGAVSDNLSINPDTLLFYVDALTGEVFGSDK